MLISALYIFFNNKKHMENKNKVNIIMVYRENNEMVEINLC